MGSLFAKLSSVLLLHPGDSGHAEVVVVVPPVFPTVLGQEFPDAPGQERTVPVLDREDFLDDFLDDSMKPPRAGRFSLPMVLIL